MSDEKDPLYKPPDVSWRLLDFVDAAPEEIEKRVVTCETCPVFALCQSGQAGTGYVCQKCKTTGVNIDEPKFNESPKDVLILDCTIHKFKVNAESRMVAQCAMCTGDLVELELRKVGPRHHLIETAYAANPPLVRQQVLRDARDKWTLKIADRKARGKYKNTPTRG